MQTNNVWEEMAARYDTAERTGIANRIARAVRDELKDTKEKTALDYGCGTGLVGLQLVGLFESMLLVDPSAQMVEQVQRKIDAGHIQGAATLCCDFLEKTPDALQVDYVIMSQVLLHIKDTRLILSKLYPILKPDGHLLIVDFDKNNAVVSDKIHNGFDAKALIRLLEEVGFAAAAAHTFHYGKAIFMNQDASLFILNAARAL